MKHEVYYQPELYTDDGTNIDYIFPDELNSWEVFHSEESARGWMKEHGYSPCDTIVHEYYDDEIEDHEFIDDDEWEEDVPEEESEENGWKGVDDVISFLDQLNDYNDELKNCVRGFNTNCTTNAELAQLLRSFCQDFEELADKVESLPEQIGKS